MHERTSTHVPPTLAQRFSSVEARLLRLEYRDEASVTEQEKVGHAWEDDDRNVQGMEKTLEVTRSRVEIISTGGSVPGRTSCGAKTRIQSSYGGAHGRVRPEGGRTMDGEVRGGEGRSTRSGRARGIGLIVDATAEELHTERTVPHVTQRRWDSLDDQYIDTSDFCFKASMMDPMKLMTEPNFDVVSQSFPSGSAEIPIEMFECKGDVSPTRISSPLQAQFSMKESSCTEPPTSLSTSAEIMTSPSVTSESFIAQVRDDDVAMTSFLPALESHIEQIDEQSGLTSLLMAVNNKDNERCVKLLMNKANVHAKDQKGRTVLHIALRNSGGEDLIPLLLKHHADPNVADKNGRTPLHYCVEYNKPNAAKILLSTLASKEATDMAGETALQLAIRRRRTNLAEILLDDGATVDRTGMSRSSDDIEYLLNQQKRRMANGVESVIIRQHSNLTTRSGLSIQTASSKSFLRQRLNMKRYLCVME